jgi:hypothetical protein
VADPWGTPIEPLLKQWREDGLDARKAQAVGTTAAAVRDPRLGLFSQELAAYLGQHASAEQLLDLEGKLRDPQYRVLFEGGYHVGLEEGVEDALAAYADFWADLARIVLSFYGSVYDRQLLEKGVTWWVTRRGTADHAAVERELNEKLATYFYIKALQKAWTELPKIESVLRKLLHESPGAVAGELLNALLDRFSSEFFAKRNPYDQGRMLGYWMGRGFGEVALLILGFVNAEGALLGAGFRGVGKVAGRIGEAVKEFTHLKLPTRLAHDIDEARNAMALRGVEEAQKAGQVDRSAGMLEKDAQALARLEKAEEAFATGKAKAALEDLGKLSGMSARELAEALAKIAKHLDELPEELRNLSVDRWAEVVEYARKNSNTFSVKGLLAEQLIPAHSKYQKLLTRAKQLVALDKRWDASTLQLVRRARGLAPTKTTSGSMGELADALLIVRAKDPKDAKQLYVVAVFESKSWGNKGDLISRSQEELGQLGWDFERIAENSMEVEFENGARATFQPGQVHISRRETTWVGIIPKDASFRRKSFDRVAGTLNFEVWNQTVADTTLQKVANQVSKAARALTKP